MLRLASGPRPARVRTKQTTPHPLLAGACLSGRAGRASSAAAHPRTRAEASRAPAAAALMAGARHGVPRQPRSSRGSGGSSGPGSSGRARQRRRGAPGAAARHRHPALQQRTAWGSAAAVAQRAACHDGGSKRCLTKPWRALLAARRAQAAPAAGAASRRATRRRAAGSGTRPGSGSRRRRAAVRAPRRWPHRVRPWLQARAARKRAPKPAAGRLASSCLAATTSVRCRDRRSVARSHVSREASGQVKPCAVRILGFARQRGGRWEAPARGLRARLSAVEQRSGPHTRCVTASLTLAAEPNALSDTVNIRYNVLLEPTYSCGREARCEPASEIIC